MEYYNPTDRTARRYALVITILIFLLGGLLLSDVVLVIDIIKREAPPIEIVFEEPEPEPIPEPEQEQESPTNVRYEQEVAHVDAASFEQHHETEGAKPETQTINTNALFKPVVGTTEELPEEGNRLASQGEEESHRGDMGGYNLRGNDQLDEGLQGRGLREGLPKPRTSFNVAGRVVVYVQVNSNGDVVSAVVEQKGTTTSDAKLHDLAVEAAMKAKFKSSDRPMQGGRITYDFKVR